MQREPIMALALRYRVSEFFIIQTRQRVYRQAFAQLQALWAIVSSLIDEI